MKKLIALTAFVLFLTEILNAQKETYSYQKALADSLAKYKVPNTQSTSQPKDSTVENADIDASVDADAWRENLEKNLQKPIEKAAKKGMKTGYYIVLVRFLVEKDGSLSDVKALNDPGYGLAEASVKVLRLGPLWKAGERNGKKVRSYHTQPITFVISEK